MSEDITCSIWRTPAKFVDDDGTGRAFGVPIIDSPRAGGMYRVAPGAGHSVALMHCNDKTKLRLTSWLVDQRLQGEPCPEITKGVIEEARGQRVLSVKKRADMLLKYIQKNISRVGESFTYMSKSALEYAMKNKSGEKEGFREEYGTVNTPAKLLHKNPVLRWSEYFMLAWSESINEDEVKFLLYGLFEQELLKEFPNQGGVIYSTLTMKGYAYLDELENKFVDSSQAFVAMWFDESTDDTWEEGIEPAIKDCGYNPVRIDQKEHSNKIDDQIIAEIRRSRFVVADFTQGDDGARGGVYYEAGFAYGLNVPVIFTCRKEVFKKVHFDVNHENFILWERPEELRDKLAKRIAAVIGDGPLERSKG